MNVDQLVTSDINLYKSVCVTSSVNFSIFHNLLHKKGFPRTSWLLCSCYHYSHQEGNSVHLYLLHAYIQNSNLWFHEQCSVNSKQPCQNFLTCDYSLLHPPKFITNWRFCSKLLIKFYSNTILCWSWYGFQHSNTLHYDTIYTVSNDWSFTHNPNTGLFTLFVA